MPYSKTKVGHDLYKVSSPSHVLARATTKKNADKQIRLLNALEHGFKPKK